MTIQERNHGIDAFRLIAAFFIILIHTHLDGLDPFYERNLRLVGRWALPFFFITSGYFLGLKMDKHGSISFVLVQRSVFKLISILVVSNIIYMLIGAVQDNYIINPNIILLGASEHLWFIGSLLFGYLFIWYIYILRIKKLLVILSIGILGFALLTNSYDQLINKTLPYDLGRFLLSVPFMYCGILISAINISRFNITFITLIVLFGMSLQYIEANILLDIKHYNHHSYQILVGIIVLSIVMFILSIRVKASNTLLAQWGQKHSLFIYLYHPVSFLILNEFTWLTKNKIHSMVLLYPFISFATVLISAILLSKYSTALYKLLTGDFKVNW